MNESLMRHNHIGQHYIEFLSAYAEGTKVQSYFEIGVNIGKSLMRINAPSVGVDPKFIIRSDVMAAKPEMHLYQTTSDDFFARKNLDQFFPEGVDLAFLDGMHLFEFLLRDFMNTERFMADGGTLFMHDCLPINAEMAERDRRPGQRKDVELKSYWTGDVWKIVPVLKKYRPDLKIHLLDCRPTGLVMVQGFSKTNNALNENYDQIVQEWQDIELTEDMLSQFYDDHPITANTTFLETEKVE